MNWSNKERVLGFTLIEIIIVLFIISIFVSFGMPKFMEMFFESNLSQTVRKAAMIVKEERLNSIIEKRDSSIVFDEKSGVIKYSKMSKESDKFDVMKLDDVRMSCSSGSTKENDEHTCEVNIYQNGMATPCRITFSNSKSNYTITIKPFIIDTGIEESG